MPINPAFPFFSFSHIPFSLSWIWAMLEFSQSAIISHARSAVCIQAIGKCAWKRKELKLSFAVSQAKLSLIAEKKAYFAFKMPYTLEIYSNTAG
jgi:hypothetical protein